jgi:uncharacterized phage protein (TIGR02218 family)
MIVLAAPMESLRIAHTHRFATCWKIIRADGTTYYFTTHDRPLSIPVANHTETYVPVSSVAPSARQKLAQLQDRNLEVRGVIDASSISFADLFAGKFRSATVAEFVVDWRYPWAGNFGVTQYVMGQISFNGEYWECQMQGITVRMKQPIGRTYGRICDANFCDARCGLHSSDFLVSYTVASVVTSQTTFTATGTAEANDFFSAGNILWSTGANAGINTDVLSYTASGNTFTLTIPATGAIQVGDTFEALAGCDKTYTTCNNRFNNIVNFRGFPFVPGTDRLIQTPNPPTSSSGTSSASTDPTQTGLPGPPAPVFGP